MSRYRSAMRILAISLLMVQAHGSPHQPAAEAVDSLSSTPPQPPPEHAASTLIGSLLALLRAERDQAIAAAIKPLASTQTHQQEKIDGLADQLKEQQEQQYEISNKTYVARVMVDTLHEQVQDIGASLQRAVEPVRLRVQAQLEDVDDRLQAMEASLNDTASRLDAVRPRSNWSDTGLPRDCSDLAAGSPSGVYMILPDQAHDEPPVSAVCDMTTDGGGWTVFQRRDQLPPQRDFFLEWAAYRDGFGQLSGEFWWGLRNLWRLTSAPDRRYELRIDMYDFDEDHRHAAYEQFGVSFEEDGFRLLGGHFAGGEAGDSLSAHFGQRFSTRDRDQDTGTTHCARTRKGGWWYHACHDANLNGPYLAGRTPKDVYGVNWPTWRGWRYSLKKVEMKIRPTPRAHQSAASSANSGH